jgi:hypothetical protein
MIGQTKCLTLSRANSLCLILQNLASLCTDPDYSANKLTSLGHALALTNRSYVAHDVACYPMTTPVVTPALRLRTYCPNAETFRRTTMKR